MPSFIAAAQLLLSQPMNLSFSAHPRNNTENDIDPSGIYFDIISMLAGEQEYHIHPTNKNLKLL